MTGVAEELRDHGLAEAFDVHDAARGRSGAALREARGAADVDAAQVDFAVLADELAAGRRGSRWGR